MFDMHWWLRTSRTIVKVYVTERNDVIKRHSNIITIWRTSAIEVTACFIKKYTFRNERCATKRIYHRCWGWWQNPSLAITVWHHSASLVMPDSDPRDGFLSIPHTNNRWGLPAVVEGKDMYVFCFYFHSILSFHLPLRSKRMKAPRW